MQATFSKLLFVIALWIIFRNAQGREIEVSEENWDTAGGWDGFVMISRNQFLEEVCFFLFCFSPLYLFFLASFMFHASFFFLPLFIFKCRRTMIHCCCDDDVDVSWILRITRNTGRIAWRCPWYFSKSSGPTFFKPVNFSLSLSSSSLSFYLVYRGFDKKFFSRTVILDNILSYFNFSCWSRIFSFM